MATATDFIKSALRRITSYQSGETVASPDIQDCLDTFNDMLDSWSATENHVNGVNENIVQWIPGQSQYRIGNPTCTELGVPPMVAPLYAGINQFFPGPLPSGLVVGAELSSAHNLIPAGTTVVALDVPGAGVTMSNNATADSLAPDTITYTLPGDFAIDRPLMITSGYTRFSQLDFTLDVFESQQEYNAILYKAQPGPWPTVAWYNNTYPYGLLYVYQTPGNGAELHLFTQTILQRLGPNSVVSLPQGYARALKWCLARELWIEYVNPMAVPTYLEKIAKESLAVIKELNAKPAKRSTYDAALYSNRPDASWIFTGGYY